MLLWIGEVNSISIKTNVNTLSLFKTSAPFFFQPIMSSGLWYTANKLNMRILSHSAQFPCRVLLMCTSHTSVPHPYHCDNPNQLHFSVDAIILFSNLLRGDWFIGELRPVPCFWTEDNCFVLNPVRVTRSGTMTPQEAWICLLKCVAAHSLSSEGIANPSVLEDNCFHVWGPSSVSGNWFALKSRYVIGLCWLHNDFA
jgi:hypothetical protein